jgi:hypothetical protein
VHRTLSLCGAEQISRFFGPDDQHAINYDLHLGHGRKQLFFKNKASAAPTHRCNKATVFD